MTPRPVARNDPCPCGSGRRYKHCHGAAAVPQAVAGVAVPRDDAAPRDGAGEPAPSAEALIQRAAAFRAAGRHERAEALLGRAVAIDPASADAWRELGVCRAEQSQPGPAVLAFERALELDPDDPLVASLLVHVRGQLCLWDGYDALARRALDAADRAAPGAKRAASPFALQAINDDPMRERAVAVLHSALHFPDASRARPPRRAAGGPLRLGWLSSDLNGHPVGRLLAGLVERLDRSRFASFGYDCDGPQPDAVWHRIRASCERFRSFAPVDRDAIAEAIREDGVDVLVDLTGYTAGTKLAIFALRPARLQIGYLGYTGTLGSLFVDGIVVDGYCVPATSADAYTERLLTVEPCYMPRCDDRGEGEPAPTRATYDLPDDAVVFAAMSAPYKILPERFDAWIAILRAVPGSLLWLRRMERAAMQRLQHRAGRLGVDPGRLRFAPNEDVAQYLARFRLADLFLDTSPFGSHTTVNDALGAGLPVLAQAGRTFAARASASMVVAAGMPDFVVATLDDYLRSAVALGRDRARLAEARRRLVANRTVAPWFDLDAYAREFGDAVERAWNETTDA